GRRRACQSASGGRAQRFPLFAAIARTRNTESGPAEESCTCAAPKIRRVRPRRSEERRVGKECRSRWGRDDYREKKGDEGHSGAWKVDQLGAQAKCSP